MMTKLVSWITVLAGTMKPIGRQVPKTESWASFGRLTDEQKKKTTVTAYFYGTGLDIKGYVDPNHGIYKVFLDGKEVPYQDGMGMRRLLRARNTLAVTLLNVKAIKLWLA